MKEQGSVIGIGPSVEDDASYMQSLIQDKNKDNLEEYIGTLLLASASARESMLEKHLKALEKLSSVEKILARETIAKQVAADLGLKSKFFAENFADSAKQEKLKKQIIKALKGSRSEAFFQSIVGAVKDFAVQVGLSKALTPEQRKEAKMQEDLQKIKKTIRKSISEPSGIKRLMSFKKGPAKGGGDTPSF